MANVKLTEADFQRTVVDLARLLQWSVVHFRRSTNKRGKHMTAVSYDAVGYPDLTLVRERVVFAELKAQRGVLSLEQIAWQERLKRAGAEVYVWRPSDMDLIEQVLTKRHG